MKLRISNVGKIYNRTEIALDGITVLAGENGMGKSTIGKALFSLFNTFSDIDGQIRHERIKAVWGTIVRFAYFFKNSALNERDLVTAIVDKIGQDVNKESIKKELVVRGFNDSDEVSLDDLTEQILEQIKIPDSSIESHLLKNRLEAEFGDRLGNVNHLGEESEIEIEIKGKTISCISDNNGLPKFSRNIEIAKKTIFIDDIHSIDTLSGQSKETFHVYTEEYSHDEDLRSRIRKGKNEDKSVISDVLSEKKISSILQQLDLAEIGDLKWENNRGWVYRQENLKDGIGLENISLGLKSFMLIRHLLKNGSIEERDILILDEPEIHLHPKWQKLYAQIIVELQKEYDLTILISTHSTDFLSFIEYYVRKSSLDDKCHFYLLHSKDNGITSMVEDVTNNTDQIYKTLSLPFLRVSEELNDTE